MGEKGQGLLRTWLGSRSISHCKRSVILFRWESEMELAQRGVIHYNCVEGTWLRYVRTVRWRKKEEKQEKKEKLVGFVRQAFD